MFILYNFHGVVRKQKTISHHLPTIIEQHTNAQYTHTCIHSLARSHTMPMRTNASGSYGRANTHTHTYVRLCCIILVSWVSSWGWMCAIEIFIMIFIWVLLSTIAGCQSSYYFINVHPQSLFGTKRTIKSVMKCARTFLRWHSVRKKDGWSLLQSQINSHRVNFWRAKLTRIHCLPACQSACQCTSQQTKAFNA